MTYVMVLVSVLLSVVLVLGAFLAGMTIANDYHRQMRNHAADILGYRRQIEQAVLPQQEPSVIPDAFTQKLAREGRATVRLHPQK